MWGRRKESCPSYIAEDRAHRDRGTTEYQEWTKSVMRRDEWTCRKCGVIGGRLHAHHILGWAKHESERYNVDNGLTLCEGCHVGVIDSNPGALHRVFGFRDVSPEQLYQWLSNNQTGDEI
jgi:5-methylcytosine-specific restriction endonuclease McrA